VAVAGLVPSSVSELGETEHLGPAGATPQPNETSPLKPLGAMVSVKVAVPPAATLAEDVESDARAIEKSVPVPGSATVCGLPATLSEIVSEPAAEPTEVGVKVTPIVQLPPAATAAHTSTSARPNRYCRPRAGAHTSHSKMNAENAARIQPFVVPMIRPPSDP
jgi:hypothetical protein